MVQRSQLWLPSRINPAAAWAAPEKPGPAHSLAQLGRFLLTWRSTFYQRTRRLQLSLTLKMPLGAAECTELLHSLERGNGKGVPAPGDHGTTTEPEPRTCGARPGAAGKASYLPLGCCQNHIPVHFTVSVTLIPAVHWADLESIPNNIKVDDKVIEHDSYTFC